MFTWLKNLVGPIDPELLKPSPPSSTYTNAIKQIDEMRDRFNQRNIELQESIDELKDRVDKLKDRMGKY